MIAAYLFSPIRDVVTATETTTKYDVVRLVATSLTAGVASTGFLAQLQQKFAAMLTAEALAKALQAADTALGEVGGAAGDHPLVVPQVQLARAQIQAALRNS